MPERASPVATVIHFVDCVNRGDVDGLAELMTDDHELRVFDEQPVRGRDANIAGWRGYVGAFPGYEILPHRISERDGTVAVLGHTSGSHLGLSDAEETTLTLVWRAEVHDGRLRSWTLSEDTPQLRRALGFDTDDDRPRARLLTDDMRHVVTEQSLGFVATVCPDGTPNLSPKGTTAVFDDDHLVFAHIHSHRTVANLASNPAIEINVVDPIVRKGYRFKGTANVVTDGELYGRLTDFFAQDRNLDAARVEAVVLVRVDRAEPLISPTYDSGASETEVAALWLQRLQARFGRP